MAGRGGRTGSYFTALLERSQSIAAGCVSGAAFGLSVGRGGEARRDDCTERDPNRRRTCRVAS